MICIVDVCAPGQKAPNFTGLAIKARAVQGLARPAVMVQLLDGHCGKEGDGQGSRKRARQGHPSGSRIESGRSNTKLRRKATRKCAPRVFENGFGTPKLASCTSCNMPAPARPCALVQEAAVSARPMTSRLMMVVLLAQLPAPHPLPRTAPSCPSSAPPPPCQLRKPVPGGAFCFSWYTT